MYAKTFSSRLARHSLVYLTVHKWLFEDATFCVNFSVTYLQKRRLPTANLQQANS